MKHYAYAKLATIVLIQFSSVHALGAGPVTLNSEFAVTTKGPMSCDQSQLVGSHVDSTSELSAFRLVGMNTRPSDNSGSQSLVAMGPDGTNAAVSGATTVGGTEHSNLGGLIGVEYSPVEPVFGFDLRPPDASAIYRMRESETGIFTGSLRIHGAFPDSFVVTYEILGATPGAVQMNCSGHGSMTLEFMIEVQRP